MAPDPYIETRDAWVEFPIFDAKTRSLKKAFLGKAGGKTAPPPEKAQSRDTATAIRLPSIDGAREPRPVQSSALSG